MKPNVKQIVMLQALCNNEQGWAKVMSRFGRVKLVQLEGFNFTEHIETWENGKCVHSSLAKQSLRLAFLDEMTFGLVLTLTTIKRAMPVMKTQKTDVIIASANSMALAALFFRAIGRTRKVVCLVSDYFPPHRKLSVRIYRWISAWLTRCICKSADEVWCVSPRIPTVKVNPRNFVVPLCVNSKSLPPCPRGEIGYIGMPSPDHALDMLFEIARKHGFRMNIIGDSPYLQTIKSSAPPGTEFHGLISDQAKISDILSRCFCGYAIYRNVSPQNYSYYGFPTKIFYWLASNTPVLTTNTAHFTQKITEFGIGRVVEPNLEHIEKAVLDLKIRYADHYEAINRFRAAWNADVEKFHQERLAVLLEDKI
jgi:glycosyltransferase involved in cell wall biosynthesis